MEADGSDEIPKFQHYITAVRRLFGSPEQKLMKEEIMLTHLVDISVLDHGIVGCLFASGMLLFLLPL